MSRRDAFRSAYASPARACKKNKKTAIGVISTTMAARATRVGALPFPAPAAIRQGAFDFVVNTSTPELSAIHLPIGKGDAATQDRRPPMNEINPVRGSCR